MNNGSGAATFRTALHLALSENAPTDVVYLLEDDFLHKPRSKVYLLQALTAFPGHYVTLYDHPDKYMTNGPNPYVKLGGESTLLYRTASSHWKKTNSTVMSFATSVANLRQHRDLLETYSQGSITDSFGLFCALAQYPLSTHVLSAVPGMSTHCELQWLSPMTDWSTI